MNDVLLTLVLVLAGAEGGALVASSVRLPRAVGQIGAGLILGPSLLGAVSAGPVVATLAEIGALCILAIAGLETNRVVMRRVGRAALLAAVGGVVLPFCGGLAVAGARAPTSARRCSSGRSSPPPASVSRPRSWASSDCSGRRPAWSSSARP